MLYARRTTADSILGEQPEHPPRGVACCRVSMSHHTNRMSCKVLKPNPVLDSRVVRGQCSERPSGQQTRTAEAA